MKIVAMLAALSLTIRGTQPFTKFHRTHRYLSTLNEVGQTAESAVDGPRAFKRIQSTGGLRRLPVVTPALELANRAKKRAFAVKEDWNIKNGRQRARKHAAVRVDTATKEMSVPIRQMLEAYQYQWRSLHP
jgi:hypothetical protein